MKESVSVSFQNVWAFEHKHIESFGIASLETVNIIDKYRFPLAVSNDVKKFLRSLQSRRGILKQTEIAIFSFSESLTKSIIYDNNT